MKRRSLLLGALGASLIPLSSPAAEPQVCGPGTLPAGARVLFQGDSITDGGRSRDGKQAWRLMGQGYPYLIAADCGGRAPDPQQSFFNRGIAGDRIDDLAARWQADTLDLKPDVLSILIGINDVTRVVHGQAPEPTLQNFRQRYAQLLEQTRKALPKLRLILAEPFASESVGGAWPRYQTLLPAYQAVVAELATRFDAPLIRYQRLFDAAAAKAPAGYWLMDGIHPTNAGHRLMADEWLRVFAAVS